MKCPTCGHLESKVLRTTADEDGDEITRHRECKECGARFYSYEGSERAPSTCDDEAVSREIQTVIGWLRIPARHQPVVRDAIKRLERAQAYLGVLATSSK